MRATAQVIPLFVLPKRCPDCMETKPITDFYPDPRKKNASTYCKKCDVRRRHERFKKTTPENQRYWMREQPKARRKAFTDEQRTADSVSTYWRGIRRRFGITASEARAMLVAQNGLCGNRACGKELSLDLDGRLFRGRRHAVVRGFIDHCHATGKVRGILCDHCNKAEGFYEKNKNLLLGIAEYLQRSELASA